MYCTFQARKKGDDQPRIPTQCPGTTGALDVLEQLQEEVRLSEFLAKREKERRQKDKELLRVVTIPNTKKAKKARRKAKSTPPMLWLKDLICTLVYGEMTQAGVRPSLTKKELIGWWNLDLQLPKLANYRLDDHFKGMAT